MGRKQAEPETMFWVAREVGDGMMAMRVPDSVEIKPAYGKYRYARQWASYVTNDPRFGDGSIVCRFWDEDLKRYVKEVIMNAPDELLNVMIDTDKADFSLQRKQEENADFRQDTSGTDDEGDYHLGALDQAAYEAYVRRENEPEEEPQYEESELIGELSSNPRIRNAQIQYMCGIIERAMDHFTEKNRMIFSSIFHNCMKETDIAEEMHVGKSAVANQKKRLMEKMAQIFRCYGFTIPTKAELKKQEKEAKRRNALLEEAQAKKKEEQRELSLMHSMTTLFYEAGAMSAAERQKLLDDLGDAA